MLCGSHPCVPAVTTKHSCSLEHEFSIPHGPPWTLAVSVFTGALKSGGCVCRYFLCRCVFRKLCHCIQKKSDIAPFSAIAFSQERSEAFRLLIKMYFNCLIERHLISSCSASRSVCLWCCRNLGLVFQRTVECWCYFRRHLPVSLYWGVQTKVWHLFVPAVQHCRGCCAGIK